MYHGSCLPGLRRSELCPSCQAKHKQHAIIADIMTFNTANENGFSVIEIGLLILVILIVGVISVDVYNRHKDALCLT